MAGTVTLTDVQDQWDDLVILLEKLRRWGDEDLISYLANFEQEAKGNYTPQGIASFTAAMRSGYQALITGGRSALGLQPILYEFGTVIDSPYRDLLLVFRDVYDYIEANDLHVPTRGLTFGTPTADGANVGTGFVNRLTRDWNNYDTEACRIETKTIICRQDANSGARRHAEIFEVFGEQPSIDALELRKYGTGPRGQVISRHAGTGLGGSLLKNSSFSTYSSGGEFSGWTKTGTVVQDTNNFYRSHPGATTDASAYMTAGSTLTQLIEDGANALDVNTPYFLRVMIKAATGSATGQLILRIGAVTKTIADVSLLSTDANGWAEVMIDLTEDCWFRNFNEEGLAIEIDFDTGTQTGSLLVDDAILTPWDIIDGTFLIITGSETPWLVDDKYTMVDSQGDATDGLRNYWTYLAGFGYLPNTSRGDPVGWADPTIPASTS